MALFLALLTDHVARARVADALKCLQRTNRAVHEVRYAESWGGLHCLARGSAAQVTVFDPYVSGKLNLDAVLSFHSSFPSPLLFAYTSWEGRTAQDIFSLVTAGIQGVADQDVDDTPEGLCSLFERTLACGMSARVLAALSGQLSPELERLLRYLLQSVHQHVTPADAARVCCCHEKTLRERLRAAHLPPTHHLIVWTRLFAVADLLGHTGQTVESAAYSLNFSSPSALRNQVQRYVGVCPTEMVERGGLEFLLGTFLNRCCAPARVRSVRESAN